MSKYIARVRTQTIGRKSMTSIWLVEPHGKTGCECLLHGAMFPASADKLLAVFEAQGIKIVREPPEVLPDESELPHGSIDETIAATAKQGELFEC